MVKRKEPVTGQTEPTVGRPTVFTDELATTICELIITGSNLNQICKRDDMPSRDTLYRWLAEKAEFSDNYMRACKIRREFQFESLQEVVDAEVDVKRARLKIDVIKWQLGKEEPKKYGDKLDLTSDGEKIGRGMTLEEINAVLARAEQEQETADKTPQAV
jgi:hypothetical protein